jgi:hypothetical protein
MKKSASVPLTILASVAALAMSGCNRRTELQRCADEQKRIVDDRMCDQRQPYTGMYPRYHWWYGGASGGRYGDAIVGGGGSPTAGFSSVRAGEGGAHGGTTRGGFGSSMGSGS